MGISEMSIDLRESEWYSLFLQFLFLKNKQTNPKTKHFDMNYTDTYCHFWLVMIRNKTPIPSLLSCSLSSLLDCSSDSAQQNPNCPSMTLMNLTSVT